MKKAYVFISNYSSDAEYMYDGFNAIEAGALIFLKNNRFRRNFLRLLKKTYLERQEIIYLWYFCNAFKKEIDVKIQHLKNCEFVFVLTARVYEKYGNFIIRYLRERYKNCSIVCYLLDLVSTMRFCLEDARRDVDLLCTFDEREANEYNMCFFREPFDTRKLDLLPEAEEILYDVTYVGAAKGQRLSKILEVYECLTEQGLKCDFHITRVPAEQQKYADNITYSGLDFKELLMHVKKSKCILEIVQDTGYSATTRYSEAMLLGKNLLTDCQEFANGNHAERNIFYFSNPKEIPVKDITKEMSYDRQKYISYFSNKVLIGQIEIALNKLKKKNGEENG